MRRSASVTAISSVKFAPRRPGTCTAAQVSHARARVASRVPAIAIPLAAVRGPNSALQSRFPASPATRTHVRSRFRPVAALACEHMFPSSRTSPLAQRALGALRLTRSFLMLEDDYDVDWEVDRDEHSRRSTSAPSAAARAARGATAPPRAAPARRSVALHRSASPYRARGCRARRRARRRSRAPPARALRHRRAGAGATRGQPEPRACDRRRRSSADTGEAVGGSHGPRVSLVTLGVDDLRRARAFYEALGWHSRRPPDDDVVFFQAGGMIFALWDRAKLAEDSGVELGSGYGGSTLAHNVRSPAEVDAVIEEAARAPVRDHARARRHLLGRLLGRLRRPGRPPVGGRPQPALDASPQRRGRSAPRRIERRDPRLGGAGMRLPLAAPCTRRRLPLCGVPLRP